MDDQDALADFAGGYGENDAVHQARKLQIKEVFLPLPGQDAEIIVPEHAGDLIGKKTRGVDHHIRFDDVGGRFQVLLLPLHPGTDYGAFGHQLSAVGHRIFHGRRGQLKGHDRSALGGKDRTHNVLAEVGLLGQHLFPAQQAHRHAPLQAPLVVHVHHVHFLFSQGYHQDPGLFEAHIQLFTEPGEHLVARETVFGLERTRVFMDAGMHDAAVGLGGTPAHFRLLFQKEHIQLVAAELPGC